MSSTPGRSLRGMTTQNSTPRDMRWPALVVLCAGMLMIVLDATIVNVALPDIQSDLGFSQSGLAWVVNAYLIAFGGLLLLAGRIGDLTSRRGVFLLGLTVFTRGPGDGRYVREVLPTTLLLGTGAGIAFPALMGLAMSGATPQDA